MAQPKSSIGSAEETSPVADIGLLLLRLVLGLLLAGYGSQKLFGWFGGPGISGTGKFFAQLGYEPGTFFAVLTGLSELVSGLLLAAGFLAPLASAIVLGVMVNAIVSTWKGGLLTLNGWELPLLFAVGAVALACTGPGRYALDTGQPWQRQGLRWTVASVVLGLSAALVTLIIKWL